MPTREHRGHVFKVHTTSLSLRHSHISQMLLFQVSPIYIYNYITDVNF